MLIGYDSLYEKLIHFLCRLNKKRGGKLLSKIGSSLIRFIFPCDIDVDAHIEKIKIPHAIGIVIGHSAYIGKNVLIMSNVTIGGRYGNNYEKNKGHCTIEDNVLIGTGAVILGRITIGENSIIGANSVITKDVPPNSVVVGNNRIIHTKTPEDHYKSLS